VSVVERLLSVLDTEHVTVRPFDGFVFLCGGAIESTDAGIASARHYALSRVDRDGKIAGHKVIIAEKMTSLMQGDDYRDLLEFEEHIAALCACVLIFVESPGSIAELGSFSVMTHLAPRLLVVCEQRFESNVAPSFIFLGPLASLRRRRAESVQVFPISIDIDGVLKADSELLGECWGYIEEAMLSAPRRSIPESRLVKDELSHRMVLVAEIVDLCAAIKLGEIEDILDGFGVNLKGKALRRVLRILEQFELIVSRTYGNDRFYHSPTSRNLVGFRLRLERGRIFDSIRFKTGMLDYFHEFDERRAKAVKSFHRAIKK